MAYLNNLYGALRAVIAATWTDVLPDGGIFDAEHIEMIAYEDLTPPYAVIFISELDSDEWGLTNLTYVAPVEIFYVAEVLGASSGIRTKLEALREAFQVYLTGDSDLTVGQVTEIGNLSWSNELLPNQIFLDKGLAHRAGVLKISCLVGETLA